MYVVNRSKHNPIFIPERDTYWEAYATFNMSPIKHKNTYYGLYRAISSKDDLQTPNRRSIIGIAQSKDCIHFENRKEFIEPVEPWEKYGCEDPRVTFFEGVYYTFYTALSNYPFSAEGIKVAVAISKDLKHVEERHLVTPFNAKAMTLFPERINGKVTVIFAAHTDSPPSKISIAQADSIEEFWNPEFWEKWHNEIDSHGIELKRFESDHTEIGAAPIKTKHGWLLIYAHIQNYFPSQENLPRIFGIEAILLDLKDPQKIVGRTRGPLVVPSESYELVGFAGNVIFPSGAIVTKDGMLNIYYGAADTTTCVAHVNLEDLLGTILPKTAELFQCRRYRGNPILLPDKNHLWEAKAVFNPAAVRIKNMTHILYRALSEDNTSYIGYASTKDGVHIYDRLAEPVYVPREPFEMKKISGANSGCEDPRLTKIGSTIYMCYTAFDGIGPPGVAITSISEKKFLARNWRWEKPVIITPSGLDDKDTCIFPEKTKNGYFFLHRINNDICGDYLKSLDFSTEKMRKCIHILSPRINSWDNSKVGISAPPIKTKYGWLLFYHGVSKNHSTYRVGVALLSLKDPGIVLARTTDPIFEPLEPYEKNGVVNNVVFPCGVVEDHGLLYIYYGGADTVVGVATIETDLVLRALRHGIEQ